jgi:hypothetical protein
VWRSRFENSLDEPPHFSDEVTVSQFDFRMPKLIAEVITIQGWQALAEIAIAKR